MTLLVTGGAGFIGSNFILHWLDKGIEQVINLDNLTYASNPSYLTSQFANPHYHFQRGDIADFELVSQLLRTYKPRAVIHFAAETHVDRSIASSSPFVKTNVLGTHTLLQASHQYWKNLSREQAHRFRFLHISTDEVYGSLNRDSLPFTESHPFAPNSPYSASKAAADHFVRAFNRTYGLPTLITHCSNNYGPNQHPEKFIPCLINSALLNKSLPIYGDGKNIRDWLFVKDHCSALECVLEKGQLGETYNIGGDCLKTNIEVATDVCHVLDALQPRENGQSYCRQITLVPDRPGHDRRYAIDASKIRRVLGWRPAVDFASGLDKTIRFYLLTDTVNCV